MYKIKVSQRLKLIREALGNISQEELAAKLLVSRQTISNWETNNPPASEDLIILLEPIFGVNPLWWKTGIGKTIHPPTYRCKNEIEFFLNIVKTVEKIDMKNKVEYKSAEQKTQMLAMLYEDLYGKGEISQEDLETKVMQYLKLVS